MIEEDVLVAFQCAFSKEKHYLIEPISLSCGHCVCKECGLCALAPDDGINNGKCELCGKINENDLKKADVNVSVKALFKFQSEQLLNTIETQFETLVDDLNDNIKQLSERVERSVDIAKENVALRVESMKTKLEELRNSIDQKLDESKNDLLRFTNKIDTNSYENQLIELKHERAAKRKVPELVFETYEHKRRKLTRHIENIKTFNEMVTFEPCEENLNLRQIGTVNCNYRKLSSRVNEAKCETNDIGMRIRDMCVLPNKRIVFAIIYKEYLCRINVYDSKFKLVKSFDKFNGHAFKVRCITSNASSQIYLSDNELNRVSMLDENFNYIRSVGTKGTENLEFNEPYGLACNNESVYVCDCENKRIQVLTLNLDFVKSLNVNYKPWLIKLNEKVACVRAFYTCSIYFYELNDNFTYKCKYDGHNGTICVFESRFYEFFHKNKQIYCYDENGILNDIVEVDTLNEISVELSAFESLVLFNNKFLLSSFKVKGFIKIPYF